MNGFKWRAVGLGLMALTAWSCAEPSPDGAELRIRTPGTRLGQVSMAVVEGDVSPPGLSFDLSNPGTCALDYAVSVVTASGGDWLAVGPTPGSLTAGGSTPIDVLLDVVTPALTPGSYVGSVIIDGSCATTGEPALGSPLAVTVNLTITPANATYTVGGTVSGLYGAGLVLENGPDLLLIEGDGAYAFPVSDGTTYDIAVAGQPTEPDQICTVSGGVGTVAGADVTDVDVDCLFDVPVTPLYGGPELLWNSYVRDDGADWFSATGDPCLASDPGPWGSCLHAGEMLTFEVYGVADCAGISAEDALGAFEWVCVPDTPNVRVVSVGLKPDARLADLIDIGTLTWRENSVTVSDAGGPILSSTSTVWYGNPIVAPVLGGATVALDVPNTVAVVADDASGTLAIPAEGVAVVVAPGATLTKSGGSVRGAVSGQPGSAFLWIEGDFAAAGNTAMVYLEGTRRSVIRHLRADGMTTSDVELVDASANLIMDAYVARGSDTFLIDPDSHHNTLVGYSSFSNRNIGLRVLGDDNVLVDILTANGDIGLTLLGNTLDPAASNILLDVTSLSNANIDVRFGRSPDTTAMNVLTANSSVGVQLWNEPATARVHNVAAANTWALVNTRGTGLGLIGTVSATWTGRMVVGLNDPNSGDTPPDDCVVGATPVSCNSEAEFGWSGSLLLTDEQGVDLSLSFVAEVEWAGPPDIADVENADGFDGLEPVGSITDWVHFESRYRGWAQAHETSVFPSFEVKLPCETGDCQLVDWRLVYVENDPFVFEVLTPPIDDPAQGWSVGTLSHRWTAATAEDCGVIPGASWDGVSCQSQLLTQAIELMRDGAGNENGLCEAAERCLFTPNLGAYQGSGDLLFLGMGGVDGDVAIYRYSANGL